MSTENVSLFVQSMINEEGFDERARPLEPSVESWVSIAADCGYEFSADDLHQFVCQVLDNPDLTEENSMPSFLSKYASSDSLSDDELGQISGGAGTRSSFRFSRSLFARMHSIGYSVSGKAASGLAGVIEARTVYVRGK